jgi:hypothetical protein
MMLNWNKSLVRSAGVVEAIASSTYAFSSTTQAGMASRLDLSQIRIHS